MTLGGAIEWSWDWQAPSTTCGVKVESDSTIISTGEAVRLWHDDAWFHFTVPSIDPGTYTALEVLYSDGNNIWRADADSSTSCVVTITSHEVVDWVHEDHHRLAGTVACDGPLFEYEGTQLTLTGVLFAIYAPESTYF